MTYHRPPLPSEVYSDLYLDVQRGHVFDDQKTFVDCVPRTHPAQILQQYAELKRSNPRPDLRAFVEEHFLIPTHQPVEATAADDLAHHLHVTWERLRREPDIAVEGSSLLPLSHPYIIPGGRFREIYYWDSYFTLLGLDGNSEGGLARSIADNLADLLSCHGLIPNGNRSYYLTRSQQPVLALIVEMVERIEGNGALTRYVPALETELDYWNDGHAPTRHAVELSSGDTLHRFYDQVDYPRIEAFAVDEGLSRVSRQDPASLYRNIRSATESGWDFSSRWFIGGTTMADIRTTEIIPVDLNCFLYRLERTLARGHRAAGSPERAAALDQAAERRAEAIHRHCWSEHEGLFLDLHFPSGVHSPHRTLATVAPLYTGIASRPQAEAVARRLRSEFLRPGGLVTSLTSSGEQWDSPNGWAPLQWMAIEGLTAYGHDELAEEIARRWIGLNASVFRRTGRLVEKYNVVDLSLEAGGGEYPTQDGFGWTNGVLSALLKRYPDAAVS